MKFNESSLVIIWLSIQLAFTSYMWMRAEKRASFLEGKDNVAQAIQQAVDEIEPPYDDQQPRKPLTRKHKGLN